MKIAIFGKKILSTRLLKEAFEARGHSVSLLRDALYFEPTDPESTLPSGFDAAYYVSGAGIVGRVCVSDFLNNKGIPIANKGIFLDPCFINKIYQAYKVSQNGILTPKTVTQVNASFDRIKSLLDSPFVLKSAFGSCGRKVYLIKDEKEFEEAKNDLRGDELLYQKFIPNDGDFRVHVVGGEAICAYKRVPEGDNFKANVSLGGGMEKIEDEDLLSKIFEISEKVAKSFKGAEIIGVDLMMHEETGEIYFLESNELPGIKEVHEVTGINIADKMVDYFESIV
jgi:ribosomal protein S6--L-glutamate ligase